MPLCSKPIFNPGPEFAEERRLWQGCPTVACTRSGRVFAGWYSGGTAEPSRENYNLLIRSDDQGDHWTGKPVLVIPSIPDAVDIDIQLWLDPLDRLWLFWVQRSLLLHPTDPEHMHVFAIRCDEPDAEKLCWSEPFPVTPGFLRCQPLALSDGRWLLPAYDWVSSRYSWSESCDQGRSWRRCRGGKKAKTPFDETMFFETLDQKIHLYARTELGFIAESISGDGGKSWSDGAASGHTAPCSRFFIRRLPSGNLLLICNDHADRRRNLTAKLSCNDGKSWPYTLLLDAADNISYPDAAVLPDGSILVLYDHGRTTFREILSARFTEEDLKNGELLDCRNSRSYLKKIVSKAPVPGDYEAYLERCKKEAAWQAGLWGPGGPWDNAKMPPPDRERD